MQTPSSNKTREDSTHGHQTDGQYQNQTDYILCSQRWRSSIQSAKTRLGADCGSDHELLIAKFRLKLKTAARTTGPFRYDLHQMPYDYTVDLHVNLWLIHVNVRQKPLQYCKVISLQLIKINEKNKK